MQAMTVFCYNNEFRAVNRLGYCYGLLLYVPCMCDVTPFFDFYIILLRVGVGMFVCEMNHKGISDRNHQNELIQSI